LFGSLLQPYSVVLKQRRINAAPVVEPIRGYARKRRAKVRTLAP